MNNYSWMNSTDILSETTEQVLVLIIASPLYFLFFYFLAFGKIEKRVGYNHGLWDIALPNKGVVKADGDYYYVLQWYLLEVEIDEHLRPEFGKPHISLACKMAIEK